METMPRVSQRAPLSCYPCSKRKMRCSKTVPCFHCVRRQIPEQCVREAVILSKEVLTSPSRTVSTPQTEAGNNGSQDSAQNHELIIRDAVPRTPANVARSAITHIDVPSVLPPAAPSSELDRPLRLTSAATMLPAENSSTYSVFQNHLDGNEIPQRYTRPQIEVEAASNLETLSWGSHQNVVEMNRGRNWALRINGSLSSSQERQVLDFHQTHIAWTHNVLHVPTLIEECRNHRQTPQSLPKAGWLSLYYAVLSVSQHLFPYSCHACSDARRKHPD